MKKQKTQGKPSILVIGSSNTDMIIRVDRIPKPGETILGGRFQTAHGGKGANQAVAAARAGGQVKFIARLGADVFGDETMDALRRDEISIGHVTRDSGAPSGVALIFVSKQGENSIAVAPGANACLSVEDVKAARDAFTGVKVLLIQLETPLATVEAAVKTAVERKVPVILNPAPACALPARLLKQISVLTPNESEAELLTGIKVRTVASAKKAAAVFLEKGVRTVVLTLGKRGALIVDRQGARLVPGYAVKAVDTTAAGDVFNGALAVALGEGKPIDDAVQFANAAAALSVTREGAQPSAPYRAEILKMQISLRP